MPLATKGSRRAKARGSLVLLVLGVFLACAPVRVSAHAELLGSSLEDGAQLDTSPGEIVLTFSEPVGLVEGSTALHGGSSDPVVLTPKANDAEVVIPLPAGLSEGSYLVQWRVISDDGHPISGIIRFTIDNGTGDLANFSTEDLPARVGGARILATAAKYIGLLLTAGTLVVGRILAPDEWQAARRWARSCAILALLGVVVEMPLVGMEQRGSVSWAMFSLVENLDSATLWAAWVCIATLLASIVAMASTSRVAWSVASALAVLALLTQLLSGHTRSKDPVWLMMIADAVHLSAAALWMGGILILTAGLSGRWSGEAFADPARVAAAISRFSSLAMYIAIVVIAAGSIMGFTILRSWDALVGTGYGATLLIKIGVVMLVLIMGGINRWRFIPRLSLDQPYAMQRLKRLVLAELVLLVLVGGITARLVDQDPNADTAAARDTGTVILDSEFALDDAHTVHLVVIDEGNGLLQVHAKLTDSDGAPVVVDDGLQLEWNMTEHGLGPIDQVLNYQESSGDYRGEISVPMTGQWDVTIRAQIDRFTDSRTTVEVNVPE